jgi:hypothetical protein
MALWTPADLPVPWKPVAWWDALGGTFVSQSGGVVSSVSDRSGNGIDLTATNSPTYASNAVTTTSFGSDYLSATGLPTTYDAAFHATPYGSGSWRTLIWNVSNNHPVLLESSSTNIGTYASGFFQAGTETWAASAGQVWLSLQSATSIAIGRDGRTPAAISGATLSLSSTVVFMNAGTGGGQGFGSLNEGIIFPPGMPTNYKQMVEGYFAWKWGTQANLPGGHPYASAAPTTGGSLILPPSRPIHHLLIR